VAAGRERTAEPEPPAVPLGGRAVAAFAQTVNNVGWPILVLAAAGLWRVLVERRRDRMAFALAAWGVVALAFVAFSVLSASDARYQQDADEFVGRVEHATYPAAVALAGYGAAWAWRRGVVLRVVSGVVLISAALVGARAWTNWFLS